MQPKFEYLLRLGDNALVLALRLAEHERQRVHGAGVELDNAARDLAGHARLWLTYAGAIEGKLRTADVLARRREPGEFRNLTLLELPNVDTPATIVRCFLFDAWHCLLLDALRNSTDTDIAAIAQKCGAEARWHRFHSAGWLIRLGRGRGESHARSQAALDALWRHTPEFFSSDELDAAMAASGTGVGAGSLRDLWMEEVGIVFGEVGLRPPVPEKTALCGKLGVHSEHLGHLLAETRTRAALHPDAAW